MWQKIKNLYHLAQALLAAIYFNFPSKKLAVIGVTGTDGKTTCVNMIYHILKSQGYKVSMISSINAIVADKTYDTGFHVTTPSPWQAQKFFKKAADSGSKYFVLEATSHGLDQNRLAFINCQIAVLTNITHEHLDYHRTYEKYRQAKLKLFKNVKYSILNADDNSYNYVKKYVDGQIITYGTQSRADFTAKNQSINLQIAGEYNLSNALAAIACASTLGIDKSSAARSLQSFEGVKGRMEEIDRGQPFKTFIDFAHTPNGLEQALKTLSSQLKTARSRLICVFGAAGERDKSKRPLMGRVAESYADLIVLTSEDPRSEDPNEIVREIVKGMKKKSEGKGYYIVIDRKDAIQFAINLAKDSDIVVTFGKGHEKSMTYAKKDLPWDEFKVTADAIKSKLKTPRMVAG